MATSGLRWRGEQKAAPETKPVVAARAGPEFGRPGGASGTYSSRVLIPSSLSRGVAQAGPLSLWSHLTSQQSTPMVGWHCRKARHQPSSGGLVRRLGSRVYLLAQDNIGVNRNGKLAVESVNQFVFLPDESTQLAGAATLDASNPMLAGSAQAADPAGRILSAIKWLRNVS